jgi:hypothetical protein
VALKITKLGRSDLDALEPSYAFAATRITITIQAFHRFFYKSGPLTGVRRHIARLPRALQACTLHPASSPSRYLAAPAIGMSNQLLFRGRKYFGWADVW